MSPPVFEETIPVCGFIVYSSELVGRIILLSVGRELLRSVLVGESSESHSKLNSEVLIVVTRYVFWTRKQIQNKYKTSRPDTMC